MNKNEVVEGHYRQNYKRLVNHVANRVPNKSHALAEEVVQEAYRRALEYYKGYDPTRAFSTWFNRILNNSCNACIQSEGGNLPSLDDEELDIEPFRIMEDLSIPLEIVVRVQEEMKAQPPERREVLNMFFNLGMKTREIAECVEFSHTNIRQIIRRFRIRFDEPVA